jgi:hypothetical protein
VLVNRTTSLAEPTVFQSASQARTSTANATPVTWA